jgi:hypothetical protein
MGQVLHGCATTTEAVRRAIQTARQSVRCNPGWSASESPPSHRRRDVDVIEPYVLERFTERHRIVRRETAVDCG